MRYGLLALSIVASSSLAGSVRAQREPPPAPSEDTGEAATPKEDESARPAPPEPAEPAPTKSEAAPGKRYEGQVDETPGSEGEPSPDTDEIGRAEDAVRAEQRHRSRFPAFSIRIDPFNWLLAGRLGFELEVAAYRFISVELVPVFVAETKPPTFNFEGRDDPLSQHSHGLGPIAGASIGAGFWLSGKPFEGYVLRAIFTNYAIRYEAADSEGVFDRVNHTERHLIGLIGSQTSFGLFTIAGGIGLGVELNQEERCFANAGTSAMMASTHGCPDGGELRILTDRQGDRVADLNGSLHPLYLVGRLSLGVTIE